MCALRSFSSDYSPDEVLMSDTGRSSGRSSKCAQQSTTEPLFSFTRLLGSLCCLDACVACLGCPDSWMHGEMQEPRRLTRLESVQHSPSPTTIPSPGSAFRVVRGDRCASVTSSDWALSSNPSTPWATAGRTSRLGQSPNANAARYAQTARSSFQSVGDVMETELTLPLRGFGENS